MSSQSGLSDRARFERFSSRWREPVLAEAGKWTRDEQVKQLLADAVLSEFRKKYADVDPPGNLEYYLRAQVCLVYSLTGQSAAKLEDYIDAHGYRETSVKAPEPAPEPAPPQPEPEPEPIPAPQPAPKPAPAPAKAPPAAAVPAAPLVSAAPAVPEKAPLTAAPSSGAVKASAPDTFLDPVRTTLWTPECEENCHVVQEIELPDEEESERSVTLSFVNTVLFLLTAVSFGFCVYQTGFLQYLMQ